MSESQTHAGGRTREVLGLLGFLLVAIAQVSNMILARGLAGSVPPFSIAFFRWSDRRRANRSAACGFARGPSPARRR
jgi:hypothetical protein